MHKRSEINNASKVSKHLETLLYTNIGSPMVHVRYEYNCDFRGPIGAPGIRLKAANTKVDTKSG